MIKPRSIVGKHREEGKYGCLKCKHFSPSDCKCNVAECIHGEKNTYPQPEEVDHKCRACKWGTFAGTRYFCILPRCAPALGRSNGVDKHGQAKKI